MATESARARWTDERLDDLRSEVSSRFDGVDRRLDRIDGRIDELHRTLFVVGGGLAASILVSAAGIVATQL